MSGVSEEASLNVEQPHVGASVIVEVNHTLLLDPPQTAPRLCFIRYTLSANQLQRGRCCFKLRERRNIESDDSQ